MKMSDERELVEAPPLTGRLLVVTDARLGHATRQVRGLMYREMFQQAGWTVEYLDLRRRLGGFWAPSWGRENEIVRAAREADAVYLLKVASLRLVDRLRRETSARIIFDMTDALWRPLHRRLGWRDLERILARCDAVFANHAYVSTYAQQYNPEVHIVPDAAPVDKFDAVRETVPPHRDECVVIGWVGSRGTVSALRKVFQPLETVAARHPAVTLRILGCRNPRRLPPFSKLRYSILPQYDEQTMIREILGMDLGIFPPPLDMEDYCSRGRLKALLYMAGGVAPVLQDAEHWKAYIRDGENGMLAADEAEWTEKIERLVASPELRRRMGRQALQTVRNEYTTRHAFEQLRQSLVAVLRSPRRPLSEPSEQPPKETFRHRLGRWRQITP